MVIVPQIGLVFQSLPSFQALLEAVAWSLAQHGGGLCGEMYFLIDPITMFEEDCLSCLRKRTIPERMPPFSSKSPTHSPLFKVESP
jgi:hypothetical protein